ncbi:MAG: hypothetical protein ACLQPH_07880, partial [Acidimicrobiales bacterium]
MRGPDPLVGRPIVAGPRARAPALRGGPRPVPTLKSDPAAADTLWRQGASGESRDAPGRCTPWTGVGP